MRFFFNIFQRYRDAFALAVFFGGVPFIYFLRDGLKLAPNNMAFSIGLIFLPFAFSLPFKNFKFFESPNKVTFPLMCYLLIYMFAYLYLKDRYLLQTSFNTELLYFIIIIFVAFSALFMRKEAIGNSFVYLVIFFSLISAMALIYYVGKNPLYIIGQRAAFSSAGETGAGNPHINSKGAYFGIVMAILSLKHHRTLKVGLIIPVVVIILCFAVLFLTQTMLAFLSTFVFGIMFLVFNLTFSNAVSTFKLFFTKWYILTLIAVGIGVLSYQINKNKELLDPAFNYVEVRFEGIKKSLFESTEEKKVLITETGDDSANTRIMHIKDVFERLNESIADGNYHYVFFGQGYKYMYIDVPHLEMLDSFGLVGFIFYTIIFLRLVVMCIREFRNPESVGTEFLAYAFIYFFFANFVAGQMLDYTRFATLFIFCRFLKK